MGAALRAGRDADVLRPGPMKSDAPSRPEKGCRRFLALGACSRIAPAVASRARCPARIGNPPAGRSVAAAPAGPARRTRTRTRGAEKPTVYDL